MTLYRTRSLNNLPDKKIEEKRNSISSEEDFNIKRIKTDMLNRYVDSNIPLEYWNLKMEKDFTGDPNLLTFYSNYTNNIHASYQEGKGYVLAGSHGLGKMLCLETDLLTPSGFIKLKDLKEGDKLFDEQGNICNVTELHPINLSPESYQITFDDGSTVNACADHLWAVQDSIARENNLKDEIKTTKELINLTDISIRNTKPINFYNIFTNTPHYSIRLDMLQTMIENISIIENGQVSVEINDSKEEIVNILHSLGIKVFISDRIRFSTTLKMFRDETIQNQIVFVNDDNHRFIESIKPIDPVPMRCITVDSPSHLFLCTKSLIPTHNTMTLTNILKSCTLKGYTALYTTLSDIVNVLTLGPNEDKFYARRELITVDFLTIDEWDNRFMANDSVSDLYARVLESIIRTRAQNKMPTLFATNSPNIIEAFSGSLKSSLSSLKNGYMVQVPVFGEDFRGKK